VSCYGSEWRDSKSEIKCNFLCAAGAGAALRRAGVTAVSTANNHAFDYGLKGLQETIKFLHQDSIRFTGTVMNVGEEFSPVIIARTE